MLALIILVLWTWGLTPVWVNIVGTALSVLHALAKVGEKELEKQRDLK